MMEYSTCRDHLDNQAKGWGGGELLHPESSLRGNFILDLTEDSLLRVDTESRKG